MCAWESSEKDIKVVQVRDDDLKQGGGEKERTGGTKLCRSNPEPLLDVWQFKKLPQIPCSSFHQAMRFMFLPLHPTGLWLL